MKVYSFIIASSLLLAACNSAARHANSEVPHQAVAWVRFIDANPNSAHLDLWFGDSKVFSNSAYKDVTRYAEVTAQRREFKVQSTDGATPGATDSESLSAGVHYTVVAAPSSDGTMGVYAVKDDTAAPGPDKAKLRVINAASEEKLAIITKSGELFPAIEGNSSTSYKEVRPADETIEIRRGAKGAEALRIPDFSLSPGRTYTIVIMGGGSEPLVAVPVVDRQGPIPTGA
jgi:hypothetical protein